ncbi:MAG: hypothetical protein ACOCV8_05115 [Spirochaetota bacterium]
MKEHRYSKHNNIFYIFIFFVILTLFIINIPINTYAQDNNDNTEEQDDTDTEEQDDNEDDAEEQDDNDDNDGNEENEQVEFQYSIEPIELNLPDITYDMDNFRMKDKGEISILISPKDPMLSYMLSTIWMGLGQIYVGDPFMGTILISIEAAMWIAGISSFFILQSEYSTYDDPELRWDEFSGESKIVVTSIILSYVALKIYNILDAYNQAIIHNRTYFSASDIFLQKEELQIYFFVNLNSINIKLKF